MIRIQIDEKRGSQIASMPLQTLDKLQLRKISRSMSYQRTATNVLILSLLVTFLAGCEKARLDEQIRELCAKDGGVKVYERVRLPDEKFDNFGFIDFYRPAQSDPLGPDYLLDRQQTFYRRGNPEMWRFHYRVLRKSDRKLLGESVMYIRRGGDMPGPWHPSSFACPEQAGETVLIRGIFNKMS